MLLMDFNCHKIKNEKIVVLFSLFSVICFVLYYLMITDLEIKIKTRHLKYIEVWFVLKICKVSKSFQLFWFCLHKKKISKKKVARFILALAHFLKLSSKNMIFFLQFTLNWSLRNDLTKNFIFSFKVERKNSRGS